MTHSKKTNYIEIMIFKRFSFHREKPELKTQGFLGRIPYRGKMTKLYLNDEYSSSTINFLHKLHKVFPQQMILQKKVFFQNSKNKRF